MKRTPIFPQLRARIVDEIERAAATTLDGADKREAVITAVTRWIDDRTKWPETPAGMLAEIADGPVIRLIVAVLVQEVYDATRRDRP